MLHERMPVILRPEAYETWLDPRNEDVGLLKNLLLPYASEEMIAYLVSPLINKPANNNEECIRAVP